MPNHPFKFESILFSHVNSALSLKQKSQTNGSEAQTTKHVKEVIDSSCWNERFLILIPLFEMSVLQPGKMVYRNLGRSGLKVSALSLGNFVNYLPENYEEDKKIVATALKHGINYFDTSQRYAQGQAQKQLGRIFKDLQVSREQIVVSSKIHTAPDADRNSSMSTNRKHVRESIVKSLKRLGLQYVDVLYANNFDDETPLEETCRAFHEVIEEGLSFYWAISNWEPEFIYQALGICERLNLHKPIVVQFQYNMLVRADVQVEFQSLFSKHGIGLAAWSPLAGGFLTGKYLNGIPENQVSRVTDKTNFFGADLLKGLYYDAHTSQKTTKRLQDLSAVAESLGFKLSHLALAWALKFEYLSTALLGARTAAQIEDNVKAIELLAKWNSEIEEKVNKILDNSPTTRTNFLTWTPYPPLRPLPK